MATNKTKATNKPSTLLIIMGVSGCGKSTLGQYLAQKLQWPFFDADDFHSASSKSHMEKGLPLTDNMRKPWIKKMLNAMASSLTKGNCVLAYSGLKAEHRKQFLTLTGHTCFVHLTLSMEAAKQRVNTRGEHFFPSNLVQTQFDALEPGTDSEIIHPFDATQSIQHNSALIEKLITTYEKD